MNDKATNLFGGKKRVVGFALVLLMIAGGLSWYISRSREPMYEGKPLSYWLECYAPLNRTETSVQESDHAIQTIGTNAIPTLLRMLQKTDSPLKVRLVALLRKQHIVKIPFHPASYYNGMGIAGFHALGSDGRNAVPELINALKHSKSSESQITLLFAFQEIGPSAENAVPDLLNLLAAAHDKMVRFFLIATLGKIHAHPEMAVPALSKCLDDPDPQIRQAAVNTLGSFGANARQAIPALELKLNDTNFETRLYALRALRQIGPKTAAQFEAETNHADSLR